VQRHLANLTTSEVTRALRALSSCYVERRTKLGTGAALDGAGKRAAFALFYGVHHFLVTREIARSIVPASAEPGLARILDFGCGTGAAGAALAAATGIARIDGLDLNRWAVAEANWTYAAFALSGRATVANIRGARLPHSLDGVVLAAYAVNELSDDVRRDLLARFLEAHRQRTAVLVIEPIGRRANPWWDEWAIAFDAHGGREDEWRFRVPLPPFQKALARGAGLDVQELTARSLYFAPQSAGV
jgi:SAM-dependent methyltransferase